MKLSAIHVLALACFGVVLVVWLKKRIPLLDRLNIPAAIVDGMPSAVAIHLLREHVVNFEMDLSLRDVAMVAFFTTIGMGASLELIKRGGPQVLIFFAVATAAAVLQNVLGIA